ncbi:MAG: NAD(P)-binding oxidoreductase [bacterium]
MNVVVFGASGKIGRMVVKLLLEQGHKVTAFVHSNNPFEASESLTIKKGDVSSLADVKEAIKGKEIVISTLGSWGTKNKNTLSTAMNTIVPAMKESGSKRIISLTGMAHWSSDTPKLKDHINSLVLNVLAPKILKDGDEHICVLEDSSLDWTVLRSPVMTNGKSSEYRLDLSTSGLIASIPRKAVVQAIVDQITEKKFGKKAAVLHRK